MLLNTDILVAVFAGWRISNMLADDAEGGPYGILHWLRAKSGVEYDNQTGSMYGTNVVSRMMICMYCNSFWIGVAFVLLYMILPNKWVTLLLLPFALSGLILTVKIVHDVHIRIIQEIGGGENK